MVNKLSPFEREAYLNTLLEKLRNHELTEGDVLATLRKNILGMNQENYAALVGLSRKTISDIENLENFAFVDHIEFANKNLNNNDSARNASEQNNNFKTRK